MPFQILKGPFFGELISTWSVQADPQSCMPLQKYHHKSLETELHPSHNIPHVLGVINFLNKYAL